MANRILLPRYIDTLNKLRNYNPDKYKNKLVLWYSQYDKNLPCIVGALNGNKLGEAIANIIDDDEIKSLPFELENKDDKPINIKKHLHFYASDRFTLRGGFYELYDNKHHVLYNTYEELLNAYNETPIHENAYYKHHYFKREEDLVTCTAFAIFK